MRAAFNDSRWEMKRASRARPLAKRVGGKRKKKSARYSLAEKEEQDSARVYRTNFTSWLYYFMCNKRPLSARYSRETISEYPQNACAILRQRSIISGTYRISMSMSPYVPLPRETSSVPRGSFLGWKGGGDIVSRNQSSDIKIVIRINGKLNQRYI